MSKKKSSSQASSSRRAETPAHSAADDSPLKPDFASWDIGQLRKYNQAFKIGSSKRTSATQAELVNGVKKHYSSLSENINETETILYFLYSLKRRDCLIKPVPFEACEEVIRQVNTTRPRLTT